MQIIGHKYKESKIGLLVSPEPNPAEDSCTLSQNHSFHHTILIVFLKAFSHKGQQGKPSPDKALSLISLPEGHYLSSSFIQRGSWTPGTSRWEPYSPIPWLCFHLGIYSSGERHSVPCTLFMPHKSACILEVYWYQVSLPKPLSAMPSWKITDEVRVPCSWATFSFPGFYNHSWRTNEDWHNQVGPSHRPLANQFPQVY